MSSMYRSVCPYDCPDSCGLLVEVENGQAVHVAGDPEHPFSRGTLCGKMNRYPETVHSPDRLTTPLRRTGPKGHGVFEPISWDDATQEIVHRWRRIIAQHGPEAILPYSYAGSMGLIQRNAGHALFHRLGASLLERTICSASKGEGWAAVMGGTPTVHPDAVMESDLILLWGINSAATNVHFLKGVQEAKKKGAKVWLIETYRTPTTTVADEVFLVKPGTDGALALGLMQQLVEQGLCNEVFLRDRVQGFDRLRDEVLPRYTPQFVGEQTRLTAETVIRMATLFGQAKAPQINIGGGISRYGNGAMTVRSIVSLPALTGAYDSPSGGCFVGTRTGTAFALDKVTRPDLIQGEPRTINMNQLGDALTQLNDPPVAGLFVYSCNPAIVAPDQNKVLLGLAREDLFTVVHERFMTDTARYADIVLPATSSLEHADVYRAYGSYCIQQAQAVISPVGQSRSNWQVFSTLARALGFEEPVFDLSTEGLIDELLAAERPLRQGIDNAAFAAGKAVELPNGPFDGTFHTPSGKIELLNPALDSELPDFFPPYGGEEPLHLMTAPAMHSLNSTFYERKDLRERQGGMKLQMNPLDAEERGLVDNQQVMAFNALGEVDFLLDVTDRVPAGTVVAEGIWWLEFAPGNRGVNALTSQKLTDMGRGSTFYDTKVDVRVSRTV